MGIYRSSKKTQGQDVLNRLRRRIHGITFHLLRDKLGPKSNAWKSLPSYIYRQLSEGEAQDENEVADDLKKWADAGVRYYTIAEDFEDEDTIFALPMETPT